MKEKVESEISELMLNIRKAKTASTRMLSELTVDGEEVKMVDSFVFLGSRIDKDVQCSEEVKGILILGRKAITNLDKVMKDKAVCMTIKIRIAKGRV